MVGFFFLKIYQHNLLIQQTYKYQRLVKNKMLLKKERNELKVQCALVRNADLVLSYAENIVHMKALKPSQIVHCDDIKGAFDFLATPSHSKYLNEIGLFDVLIGVTGGMIYAGTRL